MKGQLCRALQKGVIYYIMWRKYVFRAVKGQVFRALQKGVSDFGQSRAHPEYACGDAAGWCDSRAMMMLRGVLKFVIGAIYWPKWSTMCVYICIYIHIYIYVYTHTHTHTHTHTYVYTYICYLLA